MLADFGAIRRDPLDYLARTWHRHGDIVQFPVPWPSYLVNDPESVREVLVTRARHFDKDTLQYRALSLVTGEGLLTAQNDPARRQRRIVQPAFHHETTGALAEHVTKAAARVDERWRLRCQSSADCVIDVDADMMHAALEIVGDSLFGTDLTGEADRLAAATLDALDVVIARARTPIAPPAWLPTPSNVALRRANAELDSAVRTMIADRRSSSPVTTADRGVPAGDGAPDMLDMLMQARDEDGVGLSDREIRDQMVTFIVAGHETVASAMTWAFALLAAAPQWQERAYAEVDAVLDRRRPTIADLPNLPIVRAILDESLRLYPPAWLITRTSTEVSEFDGWQVPAGALIIMSPWLLHRHPDLWSRPDEFDPGRFLQDGVGRWSFIPFGAGPRLCIGRDFALLEGVLLLASLLGSFHVEFPPGQGVPVAEPQVTMRPVQGLPLRVSDRR
jgi:cytochrome P450